MGNPLSTHTEASTKLITAHQAHHCDDHARSQSRDKLATTKHRGRAKTQFKLDHPLNQNVLYNVGTYNIVLQQSLSALSCTVWSLSSGVVLGEAEGPKS